jgi:flagellar hook-associated protein 2
VAEELGLTAAAVGGVITGSRLVSGLKTTLLSSLAGGEGLGSLGVLALTDRSGATANVNLAAAQTLDDVIQAINAASVGITADYNAARNGLVLTDTTGATSSNLIAASGDATNTATKLGLAGNIAANAINSGSLDRQVVSRNTLLSTYKAGGAVSLGSFLIRDSSGNQGAVNLSVLAPTTIGDVIDAINGLSVSVEARINESGDGILLVDTAGGSGTLTVSDVGAGHSAADLGLAGTGQSATIDSQAVQVIDGSTTVEIALEADETLDDLVAKINEAAGGVTASVLSDPSGSRRHHLSLLSAVAGSAGELLIDGTELGLSFTDLAAAQDAVLQVGSAAGGHLVSGSSNRFTDVLPGIGVTLQSASAETVTVNVTQTVSGVSGAIQTFVDNYNKLRDKLDVYTAYDPEKGTKGTLFASAETLRIDAELTRLLTGRHLNDGSVQSLAELGVSINELGDLAFDKTKLEARYGADPGGVIEFFADETRGFAVKADAVLESLVGRNSSLLVNRATTLQTQIDAYTERIEVWNARLERNRESLFLEFARLEEVISRVQNNLTAIQQIQFIGPIQSSN